MNEKAKDDKIIIFAFSFWGQPIIEGWNCALIYNLRSKIVLFIFHFFVWNQGHARIKPLFGFELLTQHKYTIYNHELTKKIRREIFFFAFNFWGQPIIEGWNYNLI